MLPCSYSKMMICFIIKIMMIIVITIKFDVISWIYTSLENMKKRQQSNAFPCHKGHLASGYRPSVRGGQLDSDTDQNL